jgi:23S rRNA (pseudouridine1915-N3)-methyltransferase
MEIRIITVGKIKEKYLSDGIAEYAKRLSRYCKLTFCQVADEKTPDKASEALNIQIKDTEGERLMKHIREQDYVIALAIDGKMLDSVELSEKIEKLGVWYQLHCFCNRRITGIKRQGVKTCGL